MSLSSNAPFASADTTTARVAMRMRRVVVTPRWPFPQRTFIRPQSRSRQLGARSPGSLGPFLGLAPRLWPAPILMAGRLCLWTMKIF